MFSTREKVLYERLVNASKVLNGEVTNKEEADAYTSETSLVVKVFKKEAEFSPKLIPTLTEIVSSVGNYASVIKSFMARTGSGLRESKDLIDGGRRRINELAKFMEIDGTDGKHDSLPIVHLRLCESRRLGLNPNRLYYFTVDETCAECLELSKVND